MSYRKSRCPVCKEDHYKQSKDELCRSCQYIFDLGKLQEKLEEDGELVVVGLDDYFTYGFYKPDNMPEKFDKYKLPNLLIELAGGKWTGGVNRRMTLSLGGKERNAVDNPRKYLVPSNRVEVLKKVIEAVRSILVWEREEAIQKGQSVLLQLASGEMTISDFNDFQKNHLVVS